MLMCRSESDLYHINFTMFLWLARDGAFDSNVTYDPTVEYVLKIIKITLRDNISPKCVTFSILCVELR